MTTLFDLATPMPAGFREVLPAQWAASHQGVRTIDVREPAEWSGELGHLADAELVPLATVSEASRGWDKDAPVVLVCKAGGRSAQAADLLVRQGFTRVMNLTGGMLAVNAQGLPVVRGSGG
jgi:rhodanese-related sulfurtransferase